MRKPFTECSKQKKERQNGLSFFIMLAGPVLPSVEIIPDRSLWRTRDNSSILKRKNQAVSGVITVLRLNQPICSLSKPIKCATNFSA